MNAVIYKGNNTMALEKRLKPRLVDSKDAVVEVTLTTICSSDIHIKHGSVPKATKDVIVVFKTK